MDSALIIDPIAIAEKFLEQSGFRDLTLRDVADGVGACIRAAVVLIEAGEWERARTCLARALVYAETVHLRTPAQPVGAPIPIPVADDTARNERVMWASRHDPYAFRHRRRPLDRSPDRG